MEGVRATKPFRTRAGRPQPAAWNVSPIETVKHDTKASRVGYTYQGCSTDGGSGAAPDIPSMQTSA